MWDYTSNSSRQWLTYVNLRPSIDSSGSLLTVSDVSPRKLSSPPSHIHPIVDFDLNEMTKQIKKSLKNLWGLIAPTSEETVHKCPSPTKNIYLHSTARSEDSDDVFVMDSVNNFQLQKQPVITKTLWPDSELTEPSKESPVTTISDAQNKVCDKSKQSANTGSSSTATSNSRGSSTTSTVLYNGPTKQTNSSDPRPIGLYAIQRVLSEYALPRQILCL
ncbi:hypothetical protein Ciccas_010867 [Cichlidogyrus casuarinus]|uniref:Uncharacterized protein n=1 Tax=Cichlidogyrus casuarinus TaxID=1844966 RepID=A0ABD2PTA0_9PLAT